MNIKTILLESNLCEDNEFLDKYVELIENNLHTEYVKNKTQVHHILPRGYFKILGKDVDESSENKVNLLFHDHILAHYYLSLCGKAHFKYQNEYAVLGMTKRANIPEDFLLTLDKLDKIYEEAQLTNSLYHKNKKYSKETIQKRAAKIKGHEVTELTRKKISDKNTGKYLNHKFLNKDGIEIRVSEEEINNYLQDGWKLGRCEATCKALSKGYNYNSKGMLGKHQSDYQKQRARECNLGPKNDSFKEACRLGRLGKILVSNDLTKDTRYVFKEDLEKYYQDGYRKGRLNKK